MTTPPTIDELDKILDSFSKAHPFADTRAYNLFHEQAKTALIALFKKEMTTILEQYRNYLSNPNDLLDELRQAINKWGAAPTSKGAKE